VLSRQPVSHNQSTKYFQNQGSKTTMNGKKFLYSQLPLISSLFCSLLVNLANIDQSQAVTVRLPAQDVGNYSNTGDNPNNRNYLTGDCRTNPQTFCDSVENPVEEFRSFFVFDLSSINIDLNNVIAATLRLQLPELEVQQKPNGSPFEIGDILPGFKSDSVEGFEEFQLFEYAGSIDELISTHSSGSVDGQQIFADLGAGNTYSDPFKIDDNDLDTYVEIPLNPDALNAIKQNAGTKFALGGKITTLDSQANSEYAFGFTGEIFNQVAPGQLDLQNGIQLILFTAIPEPTSVISLLSVGILGLLGRKRTNNSDDQNN
jgi:hypothetical protein